MKNLPLRWKLTLHTAGLAALVLIAFGLGVSWHLYKDGLGAVDVGLREVSKGFFAELEKRHHAVNWQDASEVESLFPAVTTLYRIEIVESGQVVYRSRNLGKQQFPALSGRRAFASVAFGGEPMRVAETFSKNVSLRLAARLYDVNETREDLLESFLAAAPVVLLLVGFGAWWIVGRALAPVDEITAAAGRITAQRLDCRLPMPGTQGDEIERLTIVLNQMIDRLEGSFLQATRFTADASHELKTPLTIIRGEIEAQLRDGENSPAQEKMLLNLLEETTRLVAISEGLLLLSRADAGRLQLETTPVDLSQLLGEMLGDIEILAERRGIEIDANLPPDIWVQANDHFLRQLLFNLFENAIKYNHAGGAIRIRITSGRASRQLAIANTGPGLTVAQAALVFDRFYRADPSRDSSAGGHGLGLSICREIVRALNGQISVSIEEPGWTEFRVVLPAGRPSQRGKLTAPPAFASAEMSSFSSSGL